MAAGPPTKGTVSGVQSVACDIVSALSSSDHQEYSLAAVARLPERVSAEHMSLFTLLSPEQSAESTAHPCEADTVPAHQSILGGDSGCASDRPLSSLQHFSHEQQHEDGSSQAELMTLEIDEDDKDDTGQHYISLPCDSSQQIILLKVTEGSPFNKSISTQRVQERSPPSSPAETLAIALIGSKHHTHKIEGDGSFGGGAAAARPVDDSYRCRCCGVGFSAKYRLTAHVRLHDGKPAHQCHQCSAQFPVKNMLSNHLLQHEGRLTCRVCGKVLATKRSLQRHMAGHTGEKNYKCVYCCKDFFDRVQLVEHVRTHTGEKPFVCHQCGTAFARNSNLLAHMRVHRKEKLYRCSICSKDFRWRNNMMLHEKKHMNAVDEEASVVRRTEARAIDPEALLSDSVVSLESVELADVRDELHLSVGLSPLPDQLDIITATET